MNYLFLVGLLVSVNSCTNYSPFDQTDYAEESEVYYSELEFHQSALAFEEFQLREEALGIEEEIEDGNDENQARLEEIQQRLGEIEVDFAWNADILAARPKIGGGTPGKPCGEEPDPNNPVSRCPMPRSALDNLYLNTDQWQEGIIGILSEDGEVVGEMVDVIEVEESEGFYVQAIFEYDIESASEIKFTKSNVNGEFRSYTLPLE